MLLPGLKQSEMRKRFAAVRVGLNYRFPDLLSFGDLPLLFERTSRGTIRRGSSSLRPR